MRKGPHLQIWHVYSCKVSRKRTAFELALPLLPRRAADWGPKISHSPINGFLLKFFISHHSTCLPQPLLRPLTRLEGRNKPEYLRRLARWQTQKEPGRKSSGNTRMDISFSGSKSHISGHQLCKVGPRSMR